MYYRNATMDPYYTCIKYRKQADKSVNGTDNFMIAESMKLFARLRVETDWESMEIFKCSLSFSCENDQKAFYKIKEVCS